MDKAESDFGFRLMSFGYKFRDLLVPRKNVLKEVGIKPRFVVLDYGCGPGGYIDATAALVGKSGRIYLWISIRLPFRKFDASLQKSS